jgi:hypothetical protein
LKIFAAKLRAKKRLLLNLDESFWIKATLINFTHQIIKFMVQIIFTFIFLIFIMNIDGFSQGREIPKDWKEVNKCGVSFLVPTNMKKKRDDAKPIDSCFASYRNSAITLGVTNDNYMGQPEEEVYESLKIDGKKARIINSPNNLRVYVVVGENTNARFSFGMGITFKKAIDAQTVRKIVESIRFIKE